jgi:phosphatidate cytidylyltransferase
MFQKRVALRVPFQGVHMLKTRLITAFVIIVLVFYCFSFTEHKWATLLFLTVGVIFAGAEFCALRWYAVEGGSAVAAPRPPLRKQHFALGLAYAVPLSIVAFGQHALGNEDSRSLGAVFAWVAFCMIASSAFFYRRAIDLNDAVNKLMNGLAGFAYITVPGLTLFKLTQLDIPGAPKAIAAYFSLAVVLMGDTGAYFIGKQFGKHKLIPKVSPQKTIEGALGGLAFSALTGVFIAVNFHLPFHWALGALAGILVGMAGQIGDLAESALKRASNCKDSSHVLPGHGGVLDRIDAILFGVPFCYIMFLFLIK